MRGASELSLAATPWSFFCSIVVVLLAAAIGFWTWKQSGYSTTRGLQELFRLLIVCVVAMLLNQPEWVQQFQPDAKPTVVVLWDDSGSMQTQDALSPTATEPITRAEAIEPLKERKLWVGGADQNREVVIQSLSAGLRAVARAPSGQPTTETGPMIQAVMPRQGTDLHQPLRAAAESIDQLLAVVLISDGDWNIGSPPVEAASDLKLRGIPLHTVVVGSPSRLPDVDLIAVDAPTFGVAGKPVRIPLVIESSLPRDYVTTVTLDLSNGQTLTRDINIAAMGRTTDALSWTPEAIGDYTVTVSVPKHPDETIIENNTISAPISIRQEKLKVLIVESFPRWEYRYLRNALSRDPGVEVACLLFQSGMAKVGGGSIDYIKAFPESIEELSKFDVVFLGDVGTELGQLTAEQCESLKGLIQYQASGLVLMPGIHGRQFELLDTALDELMPVLLDFEQPGGWGSRTAGHFELTERGRRSLLTRLAETDNAEVWENLPGFQWYAPVIRAKAGSDVLAVHREMTNQFGRVPLLVTRTFGSGKVLFMGTDGAWRWRKGVEDKYHYRFWGQVVRWMAYQRNMAEGEKMRLIYSPDQPQLDQMMALRAHVMDDSGEPLQSGEVVVMVKTPSGQTQSVRLRSEGEGWGTFVGQFTPKETGNHNVTVVSEQSSAILEASFFVHGNEQEPIGKPARPDVLEELARLTGGSSVSPQQLDSVIQSLASLPDPPPQFRRLQLWSHPLTAALLIVMLGGFWIWRKTSGLI